MSRVKCLSLLLLLLSVYSTTAAAEYPVPCAAYSVYAEDLDLDGDKDIVVGHNYNLQTEWSGISILENNGYGEFTLVDSIFLYAGQTDVQINNLNADESREIIAKYYDIEEENEYIAIINNFYKYDITYFSLTTNDGVGYITTGDIDNDNDIDIVVASNNGFFWGFLLNDGEGGFSLPTYYDLSFPPIGLACGDIDGDGGDEIVVSGQETYMYSYPITPQPLVLDNVNYNARVTIADMDNDGDNDVIAYEYEFFLDWTDIRIYENLGNDTFQTHQIVYEFGLSDFLISDVDHDSLPDILGCEYILYNEDNFNLSDPCYYTLFNDTVYAYHKDFFCSDLDGNEYDDMIAVRYFGQSTPSLLNIVFNDGNGNFVQEPQVGIDPQYPHASDVTLSLYPNPRNNQTTIEFSIKERGLVELNIYDVKGRFVKELIKQNMKGGTYNVVWNGKDENNRRCSSGIYLTKIKLDEIKVKAEKILMLR